ncbi:MULTISPECIES: NHLP family bacteriocin export ABC transporter peptidase/permease/ATPase subunit [Calothrix]|uniref:NHLP family bacteriocin export ABC transporter peptidase/permease/ATPase subunit n=2 Tax=Calothrix TaxID=1186 RepID=A0ABR8AH79_9CYAN|nr:MULTISPECIES: NHLP family bacteriocin export ABC transporter peptidase/permease/ATPase subunit [Calothrix]MBD2199407.1 NHLP family bacteriocin export ABC transporter peptidase/permease/ATPase subunit [Calothrix parietina FACHB-288]MBD2228208.1 NHLP family bacteriocin export ABC transporter peptidase/permease/ATPase subunit [Calothrix anomala FACHB-343]
MKFLFNKIPSIRRTPTLLQMEAVECGAAALGMILGYYGRIIPLAELRQACGISRDGSKASNILNAARSYGLQAKGFKADLPALEQIQCPYIVFWNFNHFLVVEGFSKQRVYLNDPATGRRTVSVGEFSEAFTGVVLVFEKGTDFKSGGHKPSLVLALTSRLRGSGWSLIYCVLAGFLLVIPGLAIPTFSRVFVDEVLIQGRDDWLRPLIFAMLFTALLSGLLTRLQLQLLRRLKIKLAMGMSSKFIWHLLHLPVSFYDQRFAGEISSRIQLNDRLANLLSGKLATTVISAVMVIFYAIVMWQYDRLLTLIGIAFVVVNLLALQWVAGLRVDTNIRLMQEQGKVSGVAIAGLQSMETLKASGLESDFFTRWAGYYAKAINVRQDMDNLNQSLGILPSFLSGITSMLLLVVGGFQVINGGLSIGMLIAFQSLMQQFMQPVSQLISLGGDLQELEGNLNRLDDVLRNPVEDSRGAEEQRSRGDWCVVSPKLEGYLELRNITFGYNRTAPPLIENFSLSLKPGQRVALVGGSGSGKSTIAKLVAGLYQPWAGEIYFDGQPKQQIPPQILVNSIATIEQDIMLFAGSVRDNLTLWDTTIPDSNLIQACRDAAVHEIVRSLPGGYNADLLEGASNLSGGQRQRLEIARALVNNPSILLMDEATSALDAETEKIIDQNLRLRGCTCVIVAHRLSTIRDCDEIIVLSRGKVVQRGTHDELSQVEGHYLDLIKSEG